MVAKSDSEFSLRIFEFQTKKIIFKKEIWVVNLLMSRFEKEIYSEEQKKIESCQLQDIYFLEKERVVVGTMVILLDRGKDDLGFFSIPDPLKMIDPSKIKIKRAVFNQKRASRLMLRQENGEDHLFYSQSDQYNNLRVFRLNPSTLEEEEVLSYWDQYYDLAEEGINNWTYSRIAPNRSLITLGDSPILFDTETNRIIHKLVLEEKLNPKQDRLRYLDNIMVWSKKGVIQIAKLVEDPTSKELRVDQMNEIFPKNYHMMVIPKNEFFLHLYRLENGNYVISYMILTYIQSGMNQRSLMSYEIDPDSLSIVNAELNPFDKNLAINLSSLPIYHSSGFLVFCCNEKKCK